MGFNGLSCVFVDQWADSVVDFSSQFSTSSWSAAQTLGEPNTFVYGDQGTAWAPQTQNGTVEHITVEFATPVFATGATIRETYGNGFVTSVEVVDQSDALHNVWSGVDPSQPGTPVDYMVNWPETAFLVKGLKITTDTDHDPSAYEEIDAIQLHGNVVAGGSPGYVETDLGDVLFYDYDNVGTAQNWRADDGGWTLNFPAGFTFDFYGVPHTSVDVTSTELGSVVKTKTLVVAFNAIAIAFLFAFKNLYRLVERLMKKSTGGRRWMMPR